VTRYTGQGHHPGHPSATLNPDRGDTTAPRQARQKFTDEDKRMIAVLVQRGYSDLDIHRKVQPRLHINQSSIRNYRKAGL
jgi:hypothetical protein